MWRCLSFIVRQKNKTQWGWDKTGKQILHFIHLSVRTAHSGNSLSCSLNQRLPPSPLSLILPVFPSYHTLVPFFLLFDSSSESVCALLHLGMYLLRMCLMCECLLKVSVCIYISIYIYGSDVWFPRLSLLLGFMGARFTISVLNLSGVSQPCKSNTSGLQTGDCVCAYVCGQSHVVSLYLHVKDFRSFVC